MMMIPRKNSYDLFGDMFKDPFFREDESKIMKTDIKEKADKYIIEVDLPGYEKQDIKMNIENEYLIINAQTNKNKEEKEDGKFVCKERYIGSCSRSFYVGKHVTVEDVHPKYESGILSFSVPKAEAKPIEEKKHYISIEG